jgi:hypothetical protein
MSKKHPNTIDEQQKKLNICFFYKKKTKKTKLHLNKEHCFRLFLLLLLQLFLFIFVRFYFKESIQVSVRQAGVLLTIMSGLFLFS